MSNESNSSHAQGSGNAADPMEFLKSMWGSMGFSLPGMVTPTLDTDELGKRIADMKAVEGWLKMNLNTLQMTIQGLEIQRATLMALQTMAQTAQGNAAAAEPAASPFAGLDLNQAFSQAQALWPWNFAQPPAAPEAAAPAAAARKKKADPA